MSLLNLVVILFLIIDPFGNVSSFLKMMEEIPPKRQRWILIREMTIALLVMITFCFLGEVVFRVLNISDTALHLTSGIILFLVAIKILFPSVDSVRANIPKGEPFLTPLAIPLIAGPSLLATIMLFAHLVPSTSEMLGAIFIAWIASVIVLLSSSFLQRVLGPNGLNACERLMGMILVLLAIQRFLEGVRHFVEACK